VRRHAALAYVASETQDAYEIRIEEL